MSKATVVIAALLLTLAVIAATTAHADTDLTPVDRVFLDHLRTQGIDPTGHEDKLISLGADYCAFMAVQGEDKAFDWLQGRFTTTEDKIKMAGSIAGSAEAPGSICPTP